AETGGREDTRMAVAVSSIRGYAHELRNLAGSGSFGGPEENASFGHRDALAIDDGSRIGGDRVGIGRQLAGAQPKYAQDVLEDGAVMVRIGVSLRGLGLEKHRDVVVRRVRPHGNGRKAEGRLRNAGDGPTGRPTATPDALSIPAAHLPGADSRHAGADRVETLAFPRHPIDQREDMVGRVTIRVEVLPLDRLLLRKDEFIRCLDEALDGDRIECRHPDLARSARTVRVGPTRCRRRRLYAGSEWNHHRPRMHHQPCAEVEEALHAGAASAVAGGRAGLPGAGTTLARRGATRPARTISGPSAERAIVW